MALETVAYTNPVTGQTVTFGDDSLPHVYYQGIQGGGLAPVDNFVVDTAYQPGAQFVRTKKKTTVVTVKLVIFGDPESADQRSSLWNTLDDILAVLEPSITQAGKLVKTDSTGTQRQLNNVQYVGGMEIEDNASDRARIAVDLLFEAYDPTWYSTSKHSTSIGASSDLFGFTVPIVVPLVVSGQAKGTSLITNAGNIYSNPTFTFSGPCENFSVENTTTGKSFAITQTLDTGDTLVVDCGQGSITYTPAGGSATPLYSAFGGNKDWLQLAPGANTLVFKRDTAENQQCSIAYYDTWNHA